MTHDVSSGTQPAVKEEDIEPVKPTGGEIISKAGGPGRQRKSKDSIRRSPGTDPLVHDAVVRTLGVSSEDEKPPPLARQEADDETTHWKLTEKGVREAKQEEEEGLSNTTLLEPDEYRPDICAVCLEVIPRNEKVFLVAA